LPHSTDTADRTGTNCRGGWLIFNPSVPFLLHIEYSKLALRAFPSAARHEYFKPHWELLYEAFFKIIFRVPTTLLAIEPKYGEIRKQIRARKHQVNLLERKRDPTTGKRPDLPPLTYHERVFK